MNIGERVIVDAAVTGDGVHHHGEIIDVYEFAHTVFYEIRFDEPDGMGYMGTTVTNPGLIRKE